MMISPIKEQIVEASKIFGWRENQTLEDFNNDFSEYYCLVDQEQLIGYVAIHHIFDEVSINQVFIDDKVRNKGLGTELLEFVLNQLSARGVINVFLEVRESNLAALKIYEKVKFDIITKRKNYYKDPQEDAIILQKILKKGEQHFV